MHKKERKRKKKDCEYVDRQRKKKRKKMTDLLNNSFNHYKCVNK